MTVYLIFILFTNFSEIGLSNISKKTNLLIVNDLVRIFKIIKKFREEEIKLR